MVVVSSIASFDASPQAQRVSWSIRQKRMMYLSSLLHIPLTVLLEVLSLMRLFLTNQSRSTPLASSVKLITAGIASIDFDDLSGLWLPFILMVIVGAVVTMVHLRYVCKKVYPGYYYEGLMSMYGMMTGTISSGVLLLRELDPDLKTPAANNLVLGSSFGILLGAPLLVLVSIAQKSYTMSLVTLGLLVVYYVILILIVNIKKKKGAKRETFLTWKGPCLPGYCLGMPAFRLSQPMPAL